MPGIHIQEAHEKVQAHRGDGRNDDIGEEIVSKLDFVVLVQELFVDDPDGGKGGVGHDDTVDDHGGHVHLFGALRSITHRQDELNRNEKDAGVAEDREEELAAAMERVEFRIS